MSYRHAMGRLTGGRAVPLPGDLDYVAPSRGASATDIATVITASTAGAAALFDSIFGRTRTPAATPEPPPASPIDYRSQVDAPASSGWILPVAIVGGAVVLGGIVLLAFGGKKKPAAVTANRRRTRRNGRRRAQAPWLVALMLVGTNHSVSGTGATVTQARRAAKAAFRREPKGSRVAGEQIYQWAGGAYARSR